MNSVLPAARCPAVVIGGSTAGLFTAYLLARGGVRVCLFEAAEELGPPARTLIVTGRLADSLGPVPSSIIANRTPVVQLFSPRSSLTIRLGEPDLIVEREGLMRLLAERAKAAGVEIRLGYRLVGLEPSGAGAVLCLESTRGGHSEHLQTQKLIAADGASSQVARLAGWEPQRMVWLRQALVAMPSWAHLDASQVWFDPQRTRYFYWLEPVSHERAVMGLIAEDARQVRESLDSFLAGQKLEPIGYQSAEVPQYNRNLQPWRQVGGARVFLVGDAATQVKMSTVGGVVSGLRGSEALARAILRGSDYRRELGALRRELDLHLLVRQMLDRCGPDDYDRLLDLVGRRAKGAVAAHTRDEISRVLLQSLAAQPKLLLLAARALTRRGKRPGR